MCFTRIMKTFHWTQFKKDGFPDNVVVLSCYHTQENKAFGKHRHICTDIIAYEDEIEQTKQRFEEARKCVVQGGAWEPVEDALWTVHEDGLCTIDKSQIRMLA